MIDIKTLPDQQVDVFIAGGGLAGLSLALQLKKARPELSVVVAEKGKHPTPQAAFKVGEAILEGSTYYLAQVLGLQEHLQKEHLLKPGFRFFTPAGDNSDITKRFELATLCNWIPELSEPSYQLDRGKLETKLGEEVRRHRVIFLDGCKVLSLSLDEMGPHSVTFLHNGTETQLKARWVIDASGITAMLKRQLNLSEQVNDHKINAAWFRVNNVITVQDWSDDPEWQARFDPEMRKLATCHLTGKGYWIWIIPLAGDFTSVGIVADGSLHPFNQINRRERAMEWLSKHEPQCAQAVADSEMLDFLVFRHFSRGCKQVLSPNRWAITGVAGIFSDPLYSPGNEFITISNTIITDTICRELDGEAIASRVDFFNELYLYFILDTSLTVVKGIYPMLDSSLIVTIKKIWHFAAHFSIFLPLIFNHKLADIDYLTFIQEELERFRILNRRLHALCEEFYAREPHHPTVDYEVYTRLRTLEEVVLKQPRDSSDEARKELLAYNIAVMESFIISLSQQLDPSTKSKSSLPEHIQPTIVAEFNDFWRSWNIVI